MPEKSIYIDIEDLNKFYGIRDANLELVKRYFNKLKIVSRGDTIKLIGDEKEITEFEIKLNQLIDYYNRYNRLCVADVKEILESSEEQSLPDVNKGVLLYSVSGKPIRARTKNQKVLVEKYKKDDLLFAIGPAGTGKTYTAIALAVRALKEKSVKRIILSRPAVEAGENLGFLPGDLREKLDPYLQPLYDALMDMIPAKKLEKLIEERVIQIAPLAFMRGRTLNDSFVVLDEAQNATFGQLKMFLTRMGETSKFIVTGDLTQIDLPKKSMSGLLSAQEILKDINGLSFVKFDRGDIIRHQLVNKIVEAYDNNQLNNKENANTN